MATLTLDFYKDDKIEMTQTEAIALAAKEGSAADGVAILVKIGGDSTNTLSFASNFESLDSIAFDNTKLNHIYMIYDSYGSDGTPKVYYSIKQTTL